jgi:hypothetical protein
MGYDLRMGAEVMWCFHWVTSPGEHWESIRRGVELHVKMARAVPVPCMSWDATPSSLPACNNGPKLANHLLSRPDHLLHFHRCLCLCYSIRPHQMTFPSDRVTMSVVAPVQQWSLKCWLSVASSTSLCCSKPYALVALTICSRDRCKRLTSAAMWHRTARLFVQNLFTFLQGCSTVSLATDGYNIHA